MHNDGGCSTAHNFFFSGKNALADYNASSEVVSAVVEEWLRERIY
jgi:hypothetical protein